VFSSRPFRGWLGLPRRGRAWLPRPLAFISCLLASFRRVDPPLFFSFLFFSFLFFSVLGLFLFCSFFFCSSPLLFLFCFSVLFCSAVLLFCSAFHSFRFSSVLFSFFCSASVHAVFCSVLLFSSCSVHADEMKKPPPFGGGARTEPGGPCFACLLSVLFCSVLFCSAPFFPSHKALLS